MSTKTEGARKEAPGIVKRTSSYFIDPTMIDRRKDWNPRFDFGEIEELAKSIKHQKEHDGVGVLTDIRVKRKADGRFELVDGDRRLTAVELLMKKGEVFDQGIPAKILDKNLPDIQALVQMFEANSGKPFLPLEEAAAYQRMRDAGMTLKQVAEAVSRKVPHVMKTLALVQADDSVRDAVASGAIKSTLAKKIASKAKGDKEAQKEMVKKATKGKTNKKELEAELVKMRRKTGNVKAKPLVDEVPEALTPAQIQRRVMLVNKLLKELGFKDPANYKESLADSQVTPEGYALGMLHGLLMASGDDSIKLPKSE